MTEHADFTPYLSRRQLLRGTAALGAGAFLSGLPLSRALAQAENWPRVEQMIRSYVGEGKVANMVAALGWRDAAPEVLALGDTTLTSAVPAGADTLYRVYSMSKPITGMGAMLCIEDGLLALDQPIAEILPAFGEMQVQKVADGPITEDNLEPAERPITVRHCLTHTAGLGYTIVQQGPLNQAYNDLGIAAGQINRAGGFGSFSGTIAPSLEAFADNLATLPLVYQPGTHWSYSVALDLLGRVIEVVSGKSFDAFLKERIFDPCGMDSTSFRVAPEDVERFTANYFVIDGELVPVDVPGSSVFEDEPPFPFGGAGIISSARDYDRFLTMLAGGGVIDGTRVMEQASVRLATSNILPDTMTAEGAFTFGDRAFGYGAGGLVGQGDTEGLFGWFGAAGTCGLVNLRFGLRHCLMTQYMPAETYPVYGQFPLAVANDALSQVFGS